MIAEIWDGSTTLSYPLLVSPICDGEAKSGNLRREGRRLPWRDNSSDRLRDNHDEGQGLPESTRRETCAEDLQATGHGIAGVFVSYACSIACDYLPNTNANIISDNHHNIKLHHSSSGLISSNLN